MPITSKSIIENTPIRDGYRVKLQYVFTDGFIKEIRCLGTTESDAYAFLEDKIGSVLYSKSKYDLDQQIAEGLIHATEDANQSEVYKAWLFKGYESKIPEEAYMYFNKVANEVLSLSLSSEQLALEFGVPAEMVQKVLNKWNYLLENKSVILAYKEIKGGM